MIYLRRFNLQYLIINLLFMLLLRYYILKLSQLQAFPSDRNHNRRNKIFCNGKDPHIPTFTCLGYQGNTNVVAVMIIQEETSSNGMSDGREIVDAYYALKSVEDSNNAKEGTP